MSGGGLTCLEGNPLTNSWFMWRMAMMMMVFNYHLMYHVSVECFHVAYIVGKQGCINLVALPPPTGYGAVMLPVEDSRHAVMAGKNILLSSKISYQTMTEELSNWKKLWNGMYCGEVSSLCVRLVCHRFIITVPCVTAPSITLHTHLHTPGSLAQDINLVSKVATDLGPCSGLLHCASTSMCLQFPETRLIQYDCGEYCTN